MNGWRLAAGLLGMFGGGYTLASWRALIRNEETQVRLYRRALVAEANVDHALCKTTENAMAGFIAKQEELLDTYRAGKTTGEQAEAWLSEQDGAS